MLDEIKMIESVAPDIIEVLQERYKILRNIYWMQPIGRRSLSESMGIRNRSFEKSEFDRHLKKRYDADN